MLRRWRSRSGKSSIRTTSEDDKKTADHLERKSSVKEQVMCTLACPLSSSLSAASSVKPENSTPTRHTRSSSDSSLVSSSGDASKSQIPQRIHLASPPRIQRAGPQETKVRLRSLDFTPSATAASVLREASSLYNNSTQQQTSTILEQRKQEETIQSEDENGSTATILPKTKQEGTIQTNGESSRPTLDKYGLIRILDDSESEDEDSLFIRSFSNDSSYEDEDDITQHTVFRKKTPPAKQSPFRPPQQPLLEPFSQSTSSASSQDEDEDHSTGSDPLHHPLPSSQDETPVSVSKQKRLEDEDEEEQEQEESKQTAPHSPLLTRPFFDVKDNTMMVLPAPDITERTETEAISWGQLGASWAALCVGSTPLYLLCFGWNGQASPIWEIANTSWSVLALLIATTILTFVCGLALSWRAATDNKSNNMAAMQANRIRTMQKEQLQRQHAALKSRLLAVQANQRLLQRRTSLLQKLHGKNAEIQRRQHEQVVWATMAVVFHQSATSSAPQPLQPSALMSNTDKFQRTSSLPQQETTTSKSKREALRQAFLQEKQEEDRHPNMPRAERRLSSSSLSTSSTRGSTSSRRSTSSPRRRWVAASHETSASIRVTHANTVIHPLAVDWLHQRWAKIPGVVVDGKNKNKKSTTVLDLLCHLDPKKPGRLTYQRPPPPPNKITKATGRCGSAAAINI